MVEKFICLNFDPTDLKMLNTTIFIRNSILKENKKKKLILFHVNIIIFCVLLT